MYTFYPGLEYNSNGRVHHLMLGNFFNISIKSPNENGACLDLVGELQLVWHDKNHDDEKLSSLKLYARPECCPGGRQAHHGQVGRPPLLSSVNIALFIFIYLNSFHVSWVFFLLIKSLCIS